MYVCDILTNDTIRDFFNQKHTNRSQKVIGAEDIHKVGKETVGLCQYYIANSISLHKLGATMTWYVISSVRENAQKIPRANIEIKAVRVRTLEGQNHDGNNAVDSLMFNQSQYNRNNTDRRVRHLLHHPEAICVVAMKYIRTHEGKNRHDIVQNRIWCQTS